jgi:hypothetical protein
MNFTDQLIDNREIAILVWLFIFLMWSLTQRNIRASFVSLIKAFFQKAVILLTIILVIYVIAIVYAFYHYKYWDLSYLSDTVVWFFGVAFVMLMNVNHAGEDGYFKKITIESIKLVVILEFVMNFYVFDLWEELILVPITAFFGALWGYSSAFTKCEQVEKILPNIMGLFGLSFIVYAIYKIATDFQSFLSVGTFREFLLPIVFTILIFPVIYFLALFVSYELLFVRINFLVKNSALAKYTKWRTMLAFHLDLRSLKKWAAKISTFKFESKVDIINAIRSVKIGNA